MTRWGWYRVLKASALLTVLYVGWGLATGDHWLCLTGGGWAYWTVAANSRLDSSTAKGVQ